MNSLDGCISALSEEVENELEMIENCLIIIEYFKNYLLNSRHMDCIYIIFVPYLMK